MRKNLRKAMSAVEMMAAGAVLIIIIWVVLYSMGIFKNVLWWAKLLNLTNWVALTQISQDQVQSFTVQGKPITYWTVAKWTFNGTKEEVVYDSGVATNLDTAVKNSEPVLTVSVDKTPDNSWNGKAVDLDLTAASNETGSIEKIATDNALSGNALTIKEVSIATDNKLTIGETKGWVIKPVGTTTFNDGTTNYNYAYRYSIAK